jgi:hypothetical protein
MNLDLSMMFHVSFSVFLSVKCWNLSVACGAEVGFCLY